MAAPQIPKTLILDTAESFDRLREVFGPLQITPAGFSAFVWDVCLIPFNNPEHTAREATSVEAMRSYLREDTRTEDLHTLYTEFLTISDYLEKERRRIQSDRMPGFEGQFPYAIHAIEFDHIVFQHLTDTE